MNKLTCSGLMETWPSLLLYWEWQNGLRLLLAKTNKCFGAFGVPSTVGKFLLAGSSVSWISSPTGEVRKTLFIRGAVSILLGRRIPS